MGSGTSLRTTVRHLPRPKIKIRPNKNINPYGYKSQEHQNLTDTKLFMQAIIEQ